MGYQLSAVRVAGRRLAGRRLLVIGLLSPLPTFLNFRGTSEPTSDLQLFSPTHDFRLTTSVP